MEAADILPYERVHVLNLSNGERFETYAIEGEAGSGVVCLNGPAARLGVPGDKVIVLTYTWLEEAEAASFKPKIVVVDERNTILKIL